MKKYDVSLKINLDKEIKNAEDDEYIDDPTLQNINIKSQSHENIRNRLLLKRFTIKIIDLILSNIVIYDNNIPAEDFINKKIETKDKWNQINLLSMKSVLGDNCRMLLLHMSNRNIWIEEKKQRINEFSFGYMFNPTLHATEFFREQVKACLNNKFGQDTNKHIIKPLMKRNTRVLALVVFYELGNINPRKMFKVLSCIIYTIIDRYVCIAYLGT